MTTDIIFYCPKCKGDSFEVSYQGKGLSLACKTTGCNWYGTASEALQGLRKYVRKSKRGF